MLKDLNDVAHPVTSLETTWIYLISELNLCLVSLVKKLKTTRA